MVSNYTPSRKPRRTDDYSPGGKSGFRPNRATIVYTSKVKGLFLGVPVVIGGIEASLRRLAHYDYWEDKVRRSLLIDTKAEILAYGMAERQMVEIAKRLSMSATPGVDTRGQRPALQWALDGIPGTVVVRRGVPSHGAAEGENAVEVPSFEEVSKDKEKFNLAFKLAYLESDPVRGRAIAQRQGPLCDPVPARGSAFHGGNGSYLRAAFRLRGIRCMTGPVGSRIRDDPLFDHVSPRLLGRMLLLFAPRASGTDHPEPQQRVDPRGGAEARRPSGLQGNDHRHRRPDREPLRRRLRILDAAGSVPRETVHDARQVREPEARLRKGRGPLARCHESAGRKASFHPERPALRSPDRSGFGRLPARALRGTRERPAQGGAGAL